MRISYSETHRGDLFGVAASGRVIRYEGAALFQFRDHRIALVWVMGDLFGLLNQVAHVSLEPKARVDVGE